MDSPPATWNILILFPYPGPLVSFPFLTPTCPHKDSRDPPRTRGIPLVLHFPQHVEMISLRFHQGQDQRLLTLCTQCLAPGTPRGSGNVCPAPEARREQGASSRHRSLGLGLLLLRRRLLGPNVITFVNTQDSRSPLLFLLKPFSQLNLTHSPKRFINFALNK